MEEEVVLAEEGFILLLLSCFEEINKEDLPFEAKDIVPILQDFITGIKSKRKKREQNSVITEKDNFHRSGYLAFIQVVWMELGK